MYIVCPYNYLFMIVDGKSSGSQYLEELLPEIGVEPAIEDRVADARAEGDTVAQTQDEVIHLTKKGVMMMVTMMMMLMIHLQRRIKRPMKQ